MAETSTASRDTPEADDAADDTFKADDDEEEKSKEWYRFIGAEDESPANKDTKFGSVWTGFKDRTTAHGIPHVDKSRGTCKLTFWLICSLGCVGLLLWQISLASIYFFDNNVDVLVSLKNKRELTFPSITLCNLNSLKRSAVESNTQLSNLLLSSRRRRSAPNLEMAGKAVGEGCSVIDDVLYCDTGVYRKQKDGRVRRSATDAYTIQEETMEILATMSEEEKSALGFQANETIIDCRYAGSGCDISEFTSYFDPIYGNCFLFNSGWTGLRLDTSKRPGRRHGLQLVVNINQDEYIDDLTEGAGILIVVHPQDSMPFPSDEGILATAGELTSIGIRQISLKRLGDPFGNCTYPEGDEKKNVYEEHYSVQYSATACYKTCYQKNVISRCDCADPEIPIEGRAFGNRAVNACRTAVSTEYDCMERTQTLFQNDELNCKCPMPCEEKMFNFEVSNVEWPSEANEETLLDNFADSLPEIVNSNDSSTALRSNVLKLEIYFQEFNYETIRERPSYRNASYVSDIGGILGLWVGCSVISMFEVVELFIDFLVLALYKCCGSNALKRCKSRMQGRSNRIESSVPETPPPPYTSTENLRNRRGNEDVQLQDVNNLSLRLI